MTQFLQNKTALVCGSTQGIGKSTAIKLAEMGANVVLIARNEVKLKEALQKLPFSGNQKHTYLVADFSKPEELKNIISEFVAKGNKVNILVNNTGGPKGGPIKDATTEEFINTFNQHLICNHILVQALYPGMIESGYGRIINVISTSVKQPLPNLGVSNTIRGAVASWSKTLANELGQYGITVNNVLPGATNTIRLQGIAEAKSEKTGETISDIFQEMAEESPMKRIAQPEEVAAAIAFLASPEASYINGINLPVDGGRTKSL
ncbi:MAG: SDR family oxidoreductase [Bacteroidetes bacterium]|nr:SDR family oxidoreductase [Bacteroidota bacterium]